MSIFGGNFTQDGPGVDKNAPPKKGLELYFELFTRKFWDLIKLNLWFLLYCIPIVTIFPALAGMYKVLIKMVQQEPVFVGYEFRKGFKESFRQSIIVGIPLSIISLIAIVSLVYYWFAGGLIIIVAMAGSIFLSMIIYFMMPQLAYVDLDLGTIIKNSILMPLACGIKPILGMVFCSFLFVMLVLYYPYSLPFILFVGFSVPHFTALFIIWPSFTKHILGEEDSK